MQKNHYYSSSENNSITKNLAALCVIEGELHVDQSALPIYLELVDVSESY